MVEGKHMFLLRVYVLCIVCSNGWMVGSRDITKKNHCIFYILFQTYTYRCVHLPIGSAYVVI